MSPGGPPPPRGPVELAAWLPPLQRDPELARGARGEAWARALAAEGVRAVFWTHEPAAEPAVLALRAAAPIALRAVVPDMRAYLREASDHGVLGAALARFRRLPPADRLAVAWRQLPMLRGALARDFATGVRVLADMELVRWGRLEPEWVVLDGSVTDLALALDNPRVVAGFLDLVRGAYRRTAGVATANYAVLVERLAAWGFQPDVVVAPFNPKGYLMHPSRDACERALKESDLEVVATHTEVAGTVPREEALAYLQGLGIRRAVVEPSL